MEAAKAMMEEKHCRSMCETICALLKQDQEQEEAQLDINSPSYKSLNRAFPREIVEKEVREILQKSELPPAVQELILGDAQAQKAELADYSVHFPLCYRGSVLFGQLLTRFDNRIIARCPITWARCYQAALDTGKSDKEARKEAEKYAKVPNADNEEFYKYRFARILTNLRVNNEPLPAESRQDLYQEPLASGKLTKSSLGKDLDKLSGKAPSNVANYFTLMPDADKSLILVPKSPSERSSGKAPYARPVLKAVFEEVLAGYAPSRPTLSLAHPDGEKKAEDGVLYCLMDPDSNVRKLQEERPVEKLSNNHLVRHRMLIFQRLLHDIRNDGLC